MVKKIALSAVLRSEKNEKPSQIRNEGYVPVVLYGQGKEAEHLKIKINDLQKAYDVVGESSLIDLSINNSDSIKVIIKEIQKDSLRGKIIHVDFYRINMKNRIEVEVPIEFIGESKAEKELGGTLMKNLETLQVNCLPGDLIDHLEVDISSLENFNDSIKVSDLKVPESFEVLANESDSVITVLEPQKIEEEEKVEEVETEEGEKKEGEGEVGEEKKEEKAEGEKK